MVCHSEECSYHGVCLSSQAGCETCGDHPKLLKLKQSRSSNADTTKSSRCVVYFVGVIICALTQLMQRDTIC